VIGVLDRSGHLDLAGVFQEPPYARPDEVVVLFLNSLSR
jgi:hypothetical protein